VNGIQYGIIQRPVFEGFLQKTADNLLRDLASLEKQAGQDSVKSQKRAAKALAALRAGCQIL
jgi:hypothetical protein